MPEKTPPPKFSSRDRTAFVKFLSPAAILIPTIIGFTLLASTKEPGFLIFAVAWLAGLIAVISWVRPIKLVTLEGDHFLISDFRTTISVPTSHLCRVEADRHNRTPTILLHFSPTTTFGSGVRMVPSKMLFNSDDYERTVAFLFDMVVANGYHPTALPVQRLKPPPE